MKENIIQQGRSAFAIQVVNAYKYKEIEINLLFKTLPFSNSLSNEIFNS